MALLAQFYRWENKQSYIRASNFLKDVQFLSVGDFNSGHVFLTTINFTWISCLFFDKCQLSLFHRELWLYFIIDTLRVSKQLEILIIYPHNIFMALSSVTSKSRLGHPVVTLFFHKTNLVTGKNIMCMNSWVLGLLSTCSTPEK